MENLVKKAFKTIFLAGAITLTACAFGCEEEQRKDREEVHSQALEHHRESPRVQVEIRKQQDIPEIEVEVGSKIFYIDPNPGTFYLYWGERYRHQVPQYSPKEQEPQKR